MCLTSTSGGPPSLGLWCMHPGPVCLQLQLGCICSQDGPACKCSRGGACAASTGAVHPGPPPCAGTIAGGRDPASALALFGQHLAPVPSANEQGLRSLIGLAHREALAQRLT